MTRFSFNWLARAAAVAAAAVVVTVCWVGCGGDDNPSGGDNNGGNNTGGNNTGGNNTGGNNTGGNNTGGGDGTFKPIEIGNQTWMDRNLNVKTADSKCYGNKADSCAKYGALYSWDEAKTVCPTGWKLPDTTDFNELFVTVGGKRVAGDKLKSKSGWKSGGNGSDEFGFAALSGGYVYPSGNTIASSGVGSYGYWWSATEYGKVAAYYLSMDYDRDEVLDRQNKNKDQYLSIRCIHTRTWGEWVVTTPPTCDAPGVETRTDKENANHKETRMVYQLSGSACTANPSDFVEIDGKKWMKKNMNAVTDSSKCYGDADSNCVKYGRMYAWDKALEICPSGSHLPSRAEFEALAEAAGGMSTAGAKLKASTGWGDNGGTDELGFAALPGGYQTYDNYGGPYFRGIGTSADWWSSHPSGSTHVNNRYSYRLYSDNNRMEAIEAYNGRDSHHSVRCVMDD